MRRKRRNHSASFKAKVAVAAVRGEKTPGHGPCRRIVRSRSRPNLPGPPRSPIAALRDSYSAWCPYTIAHRSFPDFRGMSCRWILSAPFSRRLDKCSLREIRDGLHAFDLGYGRPLPGDRGRRLVEKTGGAMKTQESEHRRVTLVAQAMQTPGEPQCDEETLARDWNNGKTAGAHRLAGRRCSNGSHWRKRWSEPAQHVKKQSREHGNRFRQQPGRASHATGVSCHVVRDERAVGLAHSDDGTGNRGARESLGHRRKRGSPRRRVA